MIWNLINNDIICRNWSNDWNKIKLNILHNSVKVYFNKSTATKLSLSNMKKYVPLSLFRSGLNYRNNRRSNILAILHTIHRFCYKISEWCQVKVLIDLSYSRRFSNKCKEHNLNESACVFKFRFELILVHMMRAHDQANDEGT